MRNDIRRTLSRTLPVLAAASLAAAPAVAQTANVSVRGRIQTQFSTVSGDSTGVFDPNAAVTSSFEIRRLRIQADVRIGENVNLSIQPSFEMGSLRMRDAYLRVGFPGTGLALTLGQEKKPFNRYELTSSNNLLSIERGARFRGATGVVAQNNLLEENGYTSHDLGASLDWTGMGNRLVLKAGMYNGAGESANDVNNAKTLAVRGIFTALSDAEGLPLLRVGASFIGRDRAVTTTATSTAFSPDSSRRTGAIGLEFEWGDFRPGLHVIGDFSTGDNLYLTTWRYSTGRNVGNLRPGTPDSAFSTFRSLHLVGAYRVQFDDPTGTRLVKMIEPALRLDLTDPNVDVADDGGTLVTPALHVYFSQNTVLRAALDLYRYTRGGETRSLTGFRLSWQTNF